MTTEPNWTPGPWPLAPTGDNKRILVGDGLVEGPRGYEVAEVYSGDCPHDVAWANARLVGAAPDLAEVAIAYERWEADLILTGDWRNELPRFTQELWDRLLEIQAMRNLALAKVRNDE